MGTDNFSQAVLIQELEALDASLDELQQQFEREDRERLGALQSLEEDLDRFGQMLTQPQDEIDLFEALRFQSYEEFHSNFLAWLLDPEGSHGLGGRFLQGFLTATGANRAIRSRDLSSTAIRREHPLMKGEEHGRLDISIRNESAGFLCAVENKVWSSEGGYQLSWYRSVLEAEYPDSQVHLVFLTRLGEEPPNPDERGHWKLLSYTTILRLVEQTIAAANGTVHEDVLTFLRQYTVTLRRNIVPEVSNDVHALARRIYRKHKQAIDLIIEHRERYEPNYVTEGFRMIREAIGKQPLWMEGTVNHPYARFLSADWAAYDDIWSEDWPHTMLLFEIQATNSRAEMYLSLTWVGEESLRSKIFQHVKANPTTFNCAEPVYTDGYIRLHTVGEILQESDYANWWDEEGIRETITRRLDGFARGEFPEINRIITECLEDYQSENG